MLFDMILTSVILSLYKLHLNVSYCTYYRQFMLQNRQSNEALQAEFHSNLNRDNSLKLNIWTKFPDMNLSLDCPQIKLTSNGRLNCKCTNLELLKICVSIAVRSVLNTCRKDACNSISGSQVIPRINIYPLLGFRKCQMWYITQYVFLK